MKPLHYPLFLATIFVFSFSNCMVQGQPNQPADIVSNENEMPTRRQLTRSFWKQDKPPAILVYPSGNLEKRFEEVARTLIEKTADYLTISVRCEKDFDGKLFENQAIIVIGSPESNRFVSAYSEKLPFEFEGEEIKMGNLRYSGKNCVGMLPFYPNPMNPNKPILLVSGTDDETILRFLENKIKEDWSVFGWGNFGYEVYQNNRRVLLGFFDDETWEMNEKVHFEFRKDPETVLETAHFKFISNFDLNEGQLSELSAHSEKSVERILTFTNNQKSTSKITHFLYPTTEQKGLILQNTEHAHVNFRTSEVHTVINDTYRDNFIGKENELILRQQLGQPKTIALERGLAIYFTEKWQKKGWKYWASRLSDSDNLLPLSEILSEDLLNHGSRYLTGCLTASFVDFLIEKFGKKTFLERYRTWIPSESEIADLEGRWKEHLAAVSSLRDTARTSESVEIPYLKGFNFAHEGYRIYNGYGSRKATESLEKLTGMGSNSVAIVPYGYMRDANTPTFLGITNRAGSENDESVIHSNVMAQKMGMSVMLKPQVWLRWGSWPGDVEMKSETDWQRFFHHYHHWIAHYAMMAEIYEMPMFCLGVEFAKATVQRNEDWRKLIRKIRGLYSGKLTYAANWGDEFEKIDFWNELDFIGLNCYYPLSHSENCPKKELKRGFEKVIKKIETVYEKYDKSLIFTEIGFRSINAPWKQPHAGERNDDFNGEHQKRCYEAVFESIENQKWCQGILWWKFPCFLEYRGEQNGSFTPNNKPAEATVRDWFLKLEN